MQRWRYMYVPNPVHACDGYAACMTHIQFTIHNWQLTIHKSELMRWRKRNPFGIKKSVKFLYAIKRKRWWYQLYYCFCQRDGRNLNKKSLVVLAMAPRKQKTVESGGIGLMSDGGEAHSAPFPIWRKFINRLALARVAPMRETILSCRTTRSGFRCPISPRCQAEQHGIGGSVNLASMANEKL